MTVSRLFTIDSIPVTESEFNEAVKRIGNIHWETFDDGIQTHCVAVTKDNDGTTRTYRISAPK